MDLHQRFTQMVVDSIETIQHSSELLAPSICDAAEALVASLVNDGKILACGSNGSAALTSYFCTALVNRFDRERPGLPALSLNTDTTLLTSIDRDHGWSQAYAQQVRTLAKSQDMLFAITTDGQDEKLVSAIQAAQDRGIRVLALNGQNGGMVREMLSDQDIEILVPSSSPARIQETHLLILHCLCDMIDNLLFGADD